MRQDAQALKRDTEALIRVSSSAGLPWIETAVRYRGEALLLQGRIQEGLAVTRQAMITGGSAGHRCFLTGQFCALAQAYASIGQAEEGLAVIDEALSFVDSSNERHFEAEIHRQRAELRLLQGDETGAEASYLKALEVARRQEARSWELRAATGLARLWQKQGKGDEARSMLGEVYGWFSRGI